MIVWQDVINIAPYLTEVTAAPTGTQQAILASVLIQVDDTAWGEFADLGRAYLAAHMAALGRGRGYVTAESVGPFSRSYGALPVTARYLSLSVFGVEYLRLLKIAMAPAALVP
jgi:hypothetical protein